MLVEVVLELLEVVLELLDVILLNKVGNRFGTSIYEGYKSTSPALRCFSLR